MVVHYPGTNQLDVERLGFNGTFSTNMPYRAMLDVERP